MTLLALARRSLAHHALSTLVTGLACALAGGLLMAVFVIRAQAYQAFTRGAPGYQAVVGAPGSPFQLVLNAAILGGAAVVVRAQTGVSLALLAWHPVLLLGPPGTVALAALAGLPAGARAYATPVGESVQA